MQIDGDLHTTIKVVDSLKIPYIAASFGGCESIVDQPAILSYWYAFSNPCLSDLMLHGHPVLKACLAGPFCTTL